jgi:D-amino-acid oxidase
MAGPEILVIGAGVSGLTTAVCLVESGRRVRLLSQRPPLNTNSAAAGASWGPYLVEDERVPEWSRTARLIFEKLAVEEPDSGVRLVNGIEAADEHVEPPAWARDVPGFQVCGPDELERLPARYVSGWRYTIPLIDMPTYLGYLTKRLDDAGVELESGTVTSFGELAGRAEILVNCTGMASRSLVPDPSIYPIRGQLVVMDNPGVDEFFQDDTHGGDMTYILPHGNRVVLGGCATEHSEHPLPVRAIAEAIIERCIAIEPKLRAARFIEDLVGFRPTRSRIRVERVELDGVPLIHNYGHGGSGVTVSWGCAQEVRRLIG